MQYIVIQYKIKKYDSKNFVIIKKFQWCRI